MNNLTLLIKPSSSACNLDCKYCFYKDISLNKDVYSNDFMNISTLENIVKNALSRNLDYINFIFKGGEPTLVGIDFYKELINLQNKYNNNNINIVNSLHTNGTNIDDNFAIFFKENYFLVEISLDGLKETHDLYRTYKNGSSSFYDVISAINILKKCKVNFNILSVVTKESAKNIDEIYEYFKSNDFPYIQFIPYIKNFEIDNQNKYIENEFKNYLDTTSFYIFLDKLFNLWYKDIKNGKFVEIRNFMDYITILKGYNPTSCGMNGFCNLNMLIESNGDVYPCDFYCLDYWKLGNINKNSLDELMVSPKALEFFNRSLYIHDTCKKCKYFKLCGGGCRRNLEPFVDNIPSFNYQCKAIKQFLDKNLNKLISISNMFDD